MKVETLTALFTKVAVGVATAAAVGGGAALLTATSTNAVQDQRITALERNAEKMDALSDKLDETNKNVAVLNERLNREVHRE